MAALPGGASWPAETTPALRLGEIRDEVADFGRPHDPTPPRPRHLDRHVGSRSADAGRASHLASVNHRRIRSAQVVDAAR